MKKNICYILILFATFLIKSATASNLNIIGLGLFDFNKQKNEAVDFRLEKRLDNTLYDLGPEEAELYELKPFYGIELTSDSAAYGIIGLYIEEKLNSNLYITPNIGVGAYTDGDGKELGSNIQFRTSLEISYEIESGNRIGISVGHISNAGLGSKNPGSEILSLSYQIPF